MTQATDDWEVPEFTKTLFCVSWGSHPSFELREERIPTSLGPGWLLVKTVSAGLNSVDAEIARREFRPISVVRPPYRVGLDFSGVVVRIGNADCRFPVGSSVFGSVPLSIGAMSEWLVVNESWCALKPGSLDHDVASGIATCSVLAEKCLRGISSEDRVLVLGGCTGVGGLALSLAKEIFEIEWIACTASHEQRGAAERSGADEVFDFHPRKDSSRASSWADPFSRGRARHEYNFIIDTVGDEGGWKLLKNGGTVISVVPGFWKNDVRSNEFCVFCHGCTWWRSRTPRDRLIKLCSNRLITPLPAPDGETLERVALAFSLRSQDPPQLTIYDGIEKSAEALQNLVKSERSQRGLVVVRFAHSQR